MVPDASKWGCKGLAEELLKFRLVQPLLGQELGRSKDSSNGAVVGMKPLA
jgi:hypothetical protein